MKTALGYALLAVALIVVISQVLTPVAVEIDKAFGSVSRVLRPKE